MAYNWNRGSKMLRSDGESETDTSSDESEEETQESRILRLIRTHAYMDRIAQQIQDFSDESGFSSSESDDSGYNQIESIDSIPSTTPEVSSENEEVSDEENGESEPEPEFQQSNNPTDNQ